MLMRVSRDRQVHQHAQSLTGSGVRQMTAEHVSADHLSDLNVEQVRRVQRLGADLRANGVG